MRKIIFVFLVAALIIGCGPSKPTPPHIFGLRRCFGTPLTNGQSDINASPTGTVFCISGTHNWALTPKTGNQFISNQLDPAILNGGNSTQFAFQGSATGVLLDGLEVENYTAANQQGAIAAVGSGWILRNLQVHDNGTGSGGAGSTGGHGWTIVGGRYYNNRQEGIGGGVNSGGETQNTTIDGVEIDHNNFTNDSYTTANSDCDNEAGGFKWVGSGNTIKNSEIHDNACRGLWADIDANNSTVTNNHVYDNWADGIMIEISRAATITNNVVTGNGFKEFSGGASPCANASGAGIFISTSGHTASGDGNIEISGNDVEDNCLAITGSDDNRGSGQELEHLNIHDNTLVGSANGDAQNSFGMFPNDGDNLSTHSITIGTNSTSGGIVSCGLTCS